MASKTMTVYGFLDAATTNAFLQKIREESTPSIVTADDMVSHIADLEAGLEAEELGGESESESKSPKPSVRDTQRRVSHSLKALIEVFSGHPCKRGDTGCLLDYIKHHVRMGAFDFGESEEDLNRLKVELRKLSLIVEHLFQNTNSLRNFFVQLTGIYAAHLIRKKGSSETRLEGKHVSVVREILRGEAARVLVLIKERTASLRRKLADQDDVEFKDVQDATIVLYREGMAKDATKKQIAGLMFALELSTGGRKVSYLDVNIDFQTWDVYNAERNKQFGFGQLDSFVKLDIEKFRDTFRDDGIDMSHIIFQSDQAKSKSGINNKYLSGPEDPRWVGSVGILKPTITLTAKEVVAGVQRVRSFLKLTKASFRGRKKEGTAFGTAHVHPIFERFFPDILKKHSLVNETLGTHWCRKVYAVAGWEIYGRKMRGLTGRTMSSAIYISLVLGHSKHSINVYLAYTTVQVRFDAINVKLFSAPPEEQLRLVYGLVADMRREISDLKEQMVQMKEIQELRAKNDDTVMSAAVGDNEEKPTPGKSKPTPMIAHLKDPVGVFHQLRLTRRPGTPWASTRHRDETIDGYAAQMKKLNIPITGASMKKMGISQKAWEPYKAGLPIANERNGEGGGVTEGKGKDEQPPDELPVLVMKDRALRPGGITTVILPIGSKVIANTDTTSSANAQKQRLKRAVETFGPDNVIESSADCTGVVMKKQKLTTSKGTTLVRDLCVR
jgi:hypothetical protein